MYDTSGLTFAVGCYRASAPAKGQVSAIWFTVLHSFAKLISKPYRFQVLLFHLTEHKYVFKPCKTASYSKKKPLWHLPDSPLAGLVFQLDTIRIILSAWGSLKILPMWESMLCNLTTLDGKLNISFKLLRLQILSIMAIWIIMYIKYKNFVCMKHVTDAILEKSELNIMWIAKALINYLLNLWLHCVLGIPKASYLIY